MCSLHLLHYDFASFCYGSLCAPCYPSLALGIFSGIFLGARNRNRESHSQELGSSLEIGIPKPPPKLEFPVRLESLIAFKTSFEVGVSCAIGVPRDWNLESLLKPPQSLEVPEGLVSRVPFKPPRSLELLTELRGNTLTWFRVGPDSCLFKARALAISSFIRNSSLQHLPSPPPPSPPTNPSTPLVFRPPLDHHRPTPPLARV